MLSLLLALPVLLLVATGAGLHFLARLERGSAQRLAQRRAEQPLAHELPYWTFLEHDGVGVIVQVDLAYTVVCALDGIDTDCLADEGLVQASDALHGILQNLPVGTVLQLLHHVDTDVSATLVRYREAASGNHPIGRALVQAKIDEIVQRGGLRRSRLHAVITTPKAGRWKWPGVDQPTHEAKLRGVLTLADQVARGLRAAGLRAHPLSRDDARQLIYEALNPGRAEIVPAPPWAAGGPWSEEQTAREQLALTGVTETAAHLYVGDSAVRVITLRALPSHTQPGLIERLQLLLPPGCSLSVAVEALDDLKTVQELKRHRERARMLATTQSKRNNEAEAQHDDVDELIDETLRSTVRTMRLAVSVVLRVPATPEADALLDQLTAEVLRTWSALNGAQGLHDTNAQLDEWLATLPGHSRSTRRWRRCTSRNVAHLLPAWQPWTGAPEPLVLLQNGRRNLVGLDPFLEPQGASAGLDNPNAFIAGVAGSGKSTAANYVLLNLIATGAGALVVDIGGSYRRIIEIFGGKYFAINEGQSLNPFFDHADILIPASGLEPERLEPERAKRLEAVLERMLCDVDRPELRNGERAVLSAAIFATYKRVTGRAPLLADLQAVLASFKGEYKDDDAIARRFAGDLRPWVTGPASRIVNRPSTIPLTTDLAAFDLKGIEGDPALRDVVMLTLTGIIWNLLDRQPRGRRKVVVFDEVWRFLMTPASAKVVEELYRTSRKYRASVMTISQSVEDFLSSPIATALINNSATCYFLRHQKGHEEVARAFRLNDQELRHFRDLRTIRGKHSEALVLYGPHHFLARVVLTPREYWIATTHPPDLQLEAAVAARHPRLSRLELLDHLATHYPGGAAAHAPAAQAA